MKDLKICIPIIFVLSVATACNHTSSHWIKIDDFESSDPLKNWTLADPQNETNPIVENPQVTEIRHEDGNSFLFKKPAADGIVGNRKAISFKRLPTDVPVGEIYTFYIRLRVEYFPNNHVLGWGSAEPKVILENVYDGFEPSLRVTDRYDKQLPEKNDGTLMVNKDPWYDHIFNFSKGRKAKPMKLDTWYEVWCVADNRTLSKGGQKYDVYLKGGDEFPQQQKVYEGADFRMKRERPIIIFQSTCNTGPMDNPYGNGGLMYDDLYMAKGVLLTSPID
ncbi:hypothetical protein [Ekhidna sp.]|uniref:hypothetical protein n=1 Tax=Ekhidna sp. TaxID=2608089 RepID=UPI003C7E971A